MKQFTIKSAHTAQMLKSPVLLTTCEQLYSINAETIFVSVYPQDEQILLGAVKGIDLTAEIKEI